MNNLFSSWALIFLMLLMFACGKEEAVSPIAPEYCDALSTYTHEFDVLTEIGTSFDYRNILTQETKSFQYAKDFSLFKMIKERILCTDISYLETATLVYRDINSDDEFRLRIKQDIPLRLIGYEDKVIDYEKTPQYYISDISGTFENHRITELTDIENVKDVYLDINDKLVYSDETQRYEGRTKNNDLLAAFDDLEGNQWLRTNSSKTESIFYCHVEDRRGAYKEINEYIQLNQLFSHLGTLEYSDRSGNEYSLGYRDEGEYSTLIGIEHEENCVEGELALSEKIRQNYYFLSPSVGQFKISFSVSISIGLESINIEKYYTIMTFDLVNHFDYQTLFWGEIILDDDKVYDYTNLETNFSEYLLHDSIELNDILFTDVYEVQYEGRKLFWNFKNGMLAFEDFSNTTFYLNTN